MTLVCQPIGSLILASDQFGRAAEASALGSTYVIYRPTTPTAAIVPANRIGTTPFVASATPDGKFKRPNGRTSPDMFAIIDPNAIQVGDYLTGAQGTYFVSSIEPFTRPLVTQCNVVISVLRPGKGRPPRVPGIQPYDVRTTATDLALITQWPAGVLQSGRTEAPRSDLPADVPLKGYMVLFPAWPGVIIRTGDRIVTEFDTVMTVSAAELTGLGWRLSTSFSEP